MIAIESFIVKTNRKRDFKIILMRVENLFFKKFKFMGGAAHPCLVILHRGHVIILGFSSKIKIRLLLLEYFFPKCYNANYILAI